MPASWSKKRRDDTEGTPHAQDNRDVDNLLKSIMDGIQKAGMIHNDGQICEVSIFKQWSVVGFK